MLSATDAEAHCLANINSSMDSAKRNPYNIRKYCDTLPGNACVLMDYVGEYLERPHVHRLLNVSS